MLTVSSFLSVLQKPKLTVTFLLTAGDGLLSLLWYTVVPCDTTPGYGHQQQKLWVRCGRTAAGLKTTRILVAKL